MPFDGEEEERIKKSADKIAEKANPMRLLEGRTTANALNPYIILMRMKQDLHRERAQNDMEGDIASLILLFNNVDEGMRVIERIKKKIAEFDKVINTCGSNNEPK